MTLEAVDTDAGLWSVQRREDDTAIVRPVTPVSTMLALGDLLPDRDLVDQSAPRLPLDATPVPGGPVEWVADVLWADGDLPPRDTGARRAASSEGRAARAGRAGANAGREPRRSVGARRARAGGRHGARPHRPGAVGARRGGLLVDWEPAAGGRPAVRTLMLVQLGGVATVVLEQWRLVRRAMAGS